MREIFQKAHISDMEVIEKLAMMIAADFELTFDEFVARAITEDEAELVEVLPAKEQSAPLVFAAGAGRY